MRIIGQIARARTHGMHLGHIFGRSHQIRHRTERTAEIIISSPATTHPHPGIGKRIADFYNAIVEELRLVYPDHIHARRA